MATKRFWIVMAESGHSNLPYRHFTEAQAFAEADRLCRVHGGKFFVMEAKGAVAKMDIQVARFSESDDDGIPF